jgi:hypothetical protein
MAHTLKAAGAGMDAGETEICGCKGRSIQKRSARGSLKANPKRNSFTVGRRRKFLDHLAASCNIKGRVPVGGRVEFNRP